jgi:hypothetical protein
MTHSEQCEFLGGELVECKCEKRSQCDKCHLFTLLTYPDGRERCQNFACERYAPKD